MGDEQRLKDLGMQVQQGHGTVEGYWRVWSESLQTGTPWTPQDQVGMFEYRFDAGLHPVVFMAIVEGGRSLVPYAQPNVVYALKPLPTTSTGFTLDG